jgi:hypothetical protein
MAYTLLLVYTFQFLYIVKEGGGYSLPFTILC